MEKDAKSIQDRFETILAETIGMAMDAGIHPSSMIGPMERELRGLRDAVADIDALARQRPRS